MCCSTSTGSIVFLTNDVHMQTFRHEQFRTKRAERSPNETSDIMTTFPSLDNAPLGSIAARGQVLPWYSARGVRQCRKIRGISCKSRIVIKLYIVWRLRWTLHVLIRRIKRSSHMKAKCHQIKIRCDRELILGLFRHFCPRSNFITRKIVKILL